MTCLDDAIVLGLVEGRLAPEVIARVDEHLDTCVSCRDVVTLVAGARAQGRVLARGDNVDRYVIGELLGAGAMGRVYSAWEPELDRRVAIKVLREDVARDQLVSEARAMAKLNHPNVVTVHEVGSTAEGVFVAMELVEGETLRVWAQTARPWREVVRVLVEIARGLAAVHAAGVIHRDVKPDNVIVGGDGRVRLGDFGLARSSQSPSSSPPGFALGSATAVAGTPAYMAPEVLRGQAASAASDQFSFGVLAYELLAGRRPHEGATWAELLRAIDGDDVRPLRAVPSWLDEAIRRCLAPAPERRFASLRAVADRLGERLSRRRPTLWIGGALVAALVASGATWFALRDRGAGATCAIGEAELAGVWNAQARDRLAAAHVRESALVALDRWATAWIAERDATCRAGEPAPRERCLEQRRGELAALLARAGQSPERALDAFASLPPPSECRSADAEPLPLAADRAGAAREVLAGLPAVRAAVALGDARTALPAATALVDKARTSEHQPTLADALLARAEARHGADRLAEAAVDARDAVVAAERGHADLLRARAWLTRVAIAGDRRDLAAADDFGAIAQAAIDRVGAPHLAATLARLRGLVAYNRGELAAARMLLAEARTQFVTLSGVRSLEVAAVDSALGSVARAAGDLDEAERRHHDALDVDRDLRGSQHRDIARDLHNLAGVARLRGDLGRALASYRAALAVEIATQGERSVAAGLTHNSIGLVLLARAELPAAQAELELAHTILDAAGHGDRAFAEHNLGLVAQAQGDHKTALAHFAAAAAIYTATIGDSALAPIRLDLDRARSELAVGDRSAARTHVTRARDRAAAAAIQWITDDAEALIAGLPRPAPPPLEPPVAQPAPAPEPAKPQPKKDVGVYGSSQNW